MTPAVTSQFALHMTGACVLGAIVGLERQLHQHMAGTRTNALVAAGASAFVMAGSLIGSDLAAPSRMASLVVSGVGFLCAGVIFKEGASVHGLNTSATMWSSAAIGVLAGLNSLLWAAILTATVILTNVAFPPLLRLLHLAGPAAETPEVRYEIVITCRIDDEMHLRTLLLRTIGNTAATLQGISRTEDEQSALARLQTEISTRGRQNELVEEIAVRLSIEPRVTSLNWLPASTIMR